LALNFRLAVNMLQLIYTLKKHNDDGFQHLPSPGFHLNARYFIDIFVTNRMQKVAKVTNNIGVTK
jgi:hypothetical protein